MNRFATKTLDILFLLRLPLLAPVWTILLLGWITGSSTACIGGGFVRASVAAIEPHLWWSLFGFSLIVSAIYVGNQIADIKSDAVNKKLFILPQGIISVKSAWVIAGICAVCGMLVALMFDFIMVSIFAVSLGLGFMYDLPPASLKNRPWGGAIACFIGHGVLTYLVGWYAARFAGELHFSFAHVLPSSFASLWPGLLPSLSAGFANVAVFVTTTIADATGDRAIGKRTFAVAYGDKATAIAATIFCAASVASCITLQFNAWVMVIPAIASLGVFGWCAIATKRETAFAAFKWPVFLLTITVALFAPVYALLILLTFFASRRYYKWRFNIAYPTFKSQ